MTLEEEVKIKLAEVFDPKNIEVLDERGDGYHFIARIISEKFEGLGRIDRSRMVYEILDEFLKTEKIHALRLDLKTPNEL